MDAPSSNQNPQQILVLQSIADALRKPTPYIQSGWRYITISSSTATPSIAVTFPAAFASIPSSITVTLYGYSLSVPTSPSSFTGVYSNLPTFHVTSITATQFTLNVQGNAVFGAVSYIGFGFLAAL